MHDQVHGDVVAVSKSTAVAVVSDRSTVLLSLRRTVSTSENVTESMTIAEVTRPYTEPLA
jgi:hypothetical protein